MSRVPATENLQVWLVPTISNTSAPTNTEVDAGTNLTPFLVRDGLKRPLPGNTVDTADVSNSYNTTVGGSYGGQPITLTLYRDDAVDDAWDALPRGTGGYIVVAPYAGATAGIDAADVVEVWPIEVISREPADIGDNEAQKFMATCAVPTAPVFDATVA